MVAGRAHVRVQNELHEKKPSHPNSVHHRKKGKRGLNKNHLILLASPSSLAKKRPTYLNSCASPLTQHAGIIFVAMLYHSPGIVVLVTVRGSKS